MIADLRKGWSKDILDCVIKIPTKVFTLDDVCEFSKHLKILHPNNNHIEEKIR